MSRRKEPPTITLERGAPDRILPKHFRRIVTRRYLPVLGLTYASSVVGIAFKKGDFLHYLLFDRTAYVMALLIALWVSVPALIWIFLKGSITLYHVADLWYKIAAALMSFVLLISFVLLPEAEAYDLRLLFAATIPVFFVMYFFFMKGGLAPSMAHPLTVLGLAFLLYGGVVSVLF